MFVKQNVDIFKNLYDMYVSQYQNYFIHKCPVTINEYVVKKI